MSDSDDFEGFSEEEDFDFDDEDEFEEEAPKKKAAPKEPKSAPATKKAATKATKEAAPKKKATTTKTTTKTTKSKASKDDDDDVFDLDDGEAAPAKKGSKSRTIEEEYTKLDQIEHALQRPDMYIGAAKAVSQKVWVYDQVEGMVFRKIEFVPGLYKIFDEILVNAADNKQRDHSMKYIHVEINTEENQISVQNDGRGIPVVIHEKEKIYVPELIFGTLLTGSNFNDDVRKVTGGRNGLGAKLANIFSTEFTIETVDSDLGKKYVQTFTNNMGERTKPEVKSSKVKSYTKITFKPDLARFGMTHLDNDIVALMTKRVYDIAGCNPDVKVQLNGENINVKNFQKYCELYLKDPSKPKIYAKPHDRWEVCVSISDGEFQQVSFVNSINTIRGGTHVKHVSEKIIKAIGEAVAKKNKAAPIKNAQIKNHLFVFVNSLIENPAFDSQTKETLTTSVKDFGSRCDIPDDMMKKILKCGVVESILNFAKSQQDVILKKQTGGKRKQRLTGMAKLDDANEAGGRNSNDCTLILTEGDSAKALAVSGLAVVGRDNYGVFPLRGKVLNVRQASHKEFMENAEVNAIKQILGLQHGKDYKSTEGLRYGHLMIMTDQDQDGSHIKGLLVNFIHFYWPSLLRVPGFMCEFITPIVKAKKNGRNPISFYTLPEYQEWKKTIEERGEKGWTIKYYKGLGTSTDMEAREYFTELDKHQLDFEWGGAEDGEMIDMVFKRERAEDRKEWLRKFVPGTYLNHEEDRLTYSNFINKELILFSMNDCERSIPSMVDGLKPGQRKILFGFFKRKLKGEIKVAQISGYIAEHSSYHHGEVSLQSTIVAMAQNYVGSNNVNLLFPSGQFGTRAMGGKDAASARYIFTRLSKITRALFRPQDDHILKYLDDDGFPIEPQWYVPVIPTVLINGAEGIGTGWSTTVLNYNPEDLVKNIKHLIHGEEIEPMNPWYRGFKGTIEFNPKKNNYIVSGIWKKVGEDKLEITELPLGVWTANYKEMLESFVVGTEKKPPILKDYKEYHTVSDVHFVVEFLDGKLAELEATKGLLEKTFKLASTLNATNMHLFDEEGRIVKYESPEHVLKAFYDLRLQCYQKRKEWMVNQLTEEWTKLDNKVRFILAVIKEEIVIRNRKRADLLQQLADMKFDPFEKSSKKKGPVHTSESNEEEEDADNNDEEDDDMEEDSKKDSKKSSKKTAAAKDNSGYDYLLSMPLWSLTWERVQQLQKERQAKEDDLKELAGTSTTTMWLRDLDEFEDALHEFYAELQLAEEQGNKYNGKGGSKKKRAPARKRKTNNDDEDDGDFVSSSAAKKAPAKKATTTSGTKSTASTTTSTIKTEKAPASSKAASSSTAAAASKNQTITSMFASKKEEDSKAAAPSTTSSSSSNANKPKSLTTIENFFNRPAPKAATSTLKDEEDIDEELLSLTERLARKAAASKSTSTAKGSTKSDAFDLSDEDEGASKKKGRATKASAAPAKKSAIAAPKKTAAAAATKKKATRVVDSDDEEEEDAYQEDSGDEKPAKKVSVPAPAKKTTAAAPKKKAADSDDDDIDTGNVISSTRSSRTSRAKAPVKYVASDDDDDEDEDAYDPMSEDD